MIEMNNVPAARRVRAEMFDIERTHCPGHGTAFARRRD
jgi:hypothetical protein